jgi:hypothetical protein
MVHIFITTKLMRLTHDDDLAKERLKIEMGVPVIGTGCKMLSNSACGSSMIEFIMLDQIRQKFAVLCGYWTT